MSKTVGQQLKEIRTQRGISLEQIAQATHIRLVFLEALEKDQRSALPSAVQGRGFLRLYAGYLGLPVEPLLEAWEGKKPLEEAQETPEAAPENEPDHEPERPAKVESKPAVIEKPALPPAPPPAYSEPEGPMPVELQDAAPPSPVESGSRAIFAAVGQQLKKQREALGLSLQEVERYTRLRQHYLQAIEDGRIDQLPSPVQGRGMLSNYASFLNLNEDALLLQFADGLQKRRIERLPKEEPQAVYAKKRPARPASVLRRFLTPDLIFGFIVVTAILFFAIRTAVSVSTESQAQAQPTTRAIAEILLTPDETEQTAQPEGSETPAPTPLASEPAQESTVLSGSSIQVDETLSVEGIVVTPLAPGATIEPINSDPLQIYIVAQQRAFLRVVIDEQLKFNGRIVPGNAYAFSGAKTINIVTGNAAALQVYFNQNELGTLGVYGQVLNLVFDTTNGMMTATPAATFTTTPTSPVTATPLLSATPLVSGTPSVTVTMTPTSTPGR